MNDRLDNDVVKAVLAQREFSEWIIDIAIHALTREAVRNHATVMDVEDVVNLLESVKRILNK